MIILQILCYISQLCDYYTAIILTFSITRSFIPTKQSDVEIYFVQ